MAITQAICTSFKVELLTGTHNLTNGANTIKAALFTSSATLSAATTAYTAPSDATADPTNTHEVTTTSTNYTGGGEALTNVTPTSSSTTAIADFNNLTFSNVSLTARGCLLYNTSASNKALMVLDFGADKTATTGDFTIQFPTADTSNAIIRIA